MLPHEGDWREAASYRHGMEINMPMISIQIKHDNKTAGRENIEKMSLTNRSSFLEIEPKNIILSSFKISEDGKAIIVRFFETEGTRTIAKLRFGKMIKSVSNFGFT